MIDTSEFARDENKTLMDIQHAMYGETVVRLFAAPPWSLHVRIPAMLISVPG
jgi:hypothetical protein